MKSLLVIALCLGLATAAPAYKAQDLMRMLRTVVQAAQDEAKPDPNVRPDFAPSEAEFKAMTYLGYSIGWMAMMAEDPEAFNTYMENEMAKLDDGSDAATRTFKRNLQAVRNRGPGGRGKQGER